MSPEALAKGDSETVSPSELRVAGHPYKLGRGSSVVERRTENPCVVSSILTLGTIPRRSNIVEALGDFCYMIL